MVAAEAAACGAPPLVARHSGLAEIADGLEAEYPPELRHLTSFGNGDVAELAERSTRSSIYPPATTSACAMRHVAQRCRAGAGSMSPGRSWRAPLESPWIFEEVRMHGSAPPADPLVPVAGDGRRAAPQRRRADLARPGAVRGGHGLHGRGRGGVRRARSFHARPRRRFEEIVQAAQGQRARRAPRRRADLLGGRGEDRPLRELRGSRRRSSPSGALQLLELWRRARHRSRRDRLPSLEPVAGAADHRHAPLPAQRRAAALRRLAQQHVRPPRPRRASAAPIERSRSATRCGRYLPDLLALSALVAVRRGRASPTCTRLARRSSRGCSPAAACRTRSRTGPSTRRSCASSTRRAR